MVGQLWWGSYMHTFQLLCAQVESEKLVSHDRDRRVVRSMASLRGWQFQKTWDKYTASALRIVSLFHH